MLRSRLLVFALVVTVATGCGRLGFASLGPGGPGPDMDAGVRDAGIPAPMDAGSMDAGSMDAGSMDAGSEVDAHFGDGGPVAVDGPATVDAEVPVDPFLTIARVNELASAGEDDDPTLPETQVEIYFASSRPGLGGGDIWRSQRATTSDAWEVPTSVTEFNTVDDETTPDISPDGLTMYFARGPVGSIHDIYASTRPDVTSPWSTPMLRTDLSSASDELAACPAPDGLTIIVNVTMLGQIWASTRAATTDIWSPRMPVTGLDAPGVGEGQAWIGDSALYFTAEGGPMGQDIWMATRTGQTSFDRLRPVTELNTAANDSDPWLSADLRTIYFTSADDIYVATR